MRLRHVVKRGFRVLFVLPLATAVLVAGSWAVYRTPLGPLVMALPQARVKQFLAAVNAGQIPTAERFVDPSLRRVELLEVGTHLQIQYGYPVFTSADVHDWTADGAGVWSTVTSETGDSYTIDWTLADDGRGHWIITDVGALREVVHDVPGL